jgi:hypothetical protein
MDWVDLAWNRNQSRALVNTAMNLWELLESCMTGGLSRKAQLHEVS